MADNFASPSILRDDEWFRRRILKWQSDGIIAAGPPPTVRELVDIFNCRLQFVFAIESETPGWHELIGACRSLRASELDIPSEHDQKYEGYLFTAAQLHAVASWITRCHVDAPWMHRWTRKAVTALRDYFVDTEEALVEPSLDTLMQYRDRDGYDAEIFNLLPSPSIEDVRNAAGVTEDDFAVSPYPGEPRDELLARTKAAYLEMKKYMQLDGKTAVSKAARDARWFARFQVGGERIAAIYESATEVDDIRSVERAIADFSRWVGITRRTLI